MPQVMLLGASGGMGGRITALWPSVPLCLGIRRREVMDGLAPGVPAVIALLDEPASLRAAMADVAVVINAVGQVILVRRPVAQPDRQEGSGRR
jgi:hypothetical protein